MTYNVLNYLENSASIYSEKIAVKDFNKSCTYGELLSLSKKAGTALSKKVNPKTPVIVYMEKGVDALCAFLGIAYAGAFYSLLNVQLPDERLIQIQSVLNANVVITSEEFLDNAKKIFPGCDICLFSELKNIEIDDAILEKRRKGAIDTDPLYINFTSGSTGTPKGIVVGHRSVIDFIDCFTEKFNITDNDILANQAPFDFDVSVKDIYSALKVGATLVIVPKHMFSSPVELIDYLCENNITTMIWAVSALCLISTFHALDYKTPTTINKILFSGEVMPYKHLRNWKEHLESATFVNLYGPTEITCNCTYHVLNKSRDYSDYMPIGKAFDNEDVFLLDEDNRKITDKNVTGEICVRGSALSLGYYSSPEQNALHFTQNPLNPYYPELIYRTGDLGKIDENDDFVFCGRKDFQIKYMGHRIELEEIERAMMQIDGVERFVCIFDEKKSKLKGYYMGNIEKDELLSVAKEKLPVFMIPGRIRKVDSMPLTKNGKTDRKKLEELYGR